MDKNIIGAIAVVVAALLWSLDGFLRVQLYSLPPEVVVFWEHLIGLIVLSPFIIASLPKFKQLSTSQWSSIALVSLLSGAFGTILYTAALGKINFIPFSVVVLLQQTQPLFAVLAASALLKEKITKRFLILAFIALVGAYMVSFPDMRVAIGDGAGVVLAALLALGAAASWGVSTAFSKFSLQGTSFLHITASRFALTPIFAIAMVFLLGNRSSLTNLEPIQWKYILFITFSTGLVALAIYYFGLQRIPASRSTLLELTWPLSAVLVGYLFLNERLSSTQWLGTLILLTSIFMVVRDIRKNEEETLNQIKEVKEI